MDDKTKIHGTFLIGVIQTFYSLNAITKEKVDNLFENISPNDWYPLNDLTYVFNLLKKNKYVSSLLFYQAGVAFIQAWYDNVGKSLAHGSIGQFKMQDNSEGIKHVFKDYDSSKLFSKVIELDIEKGYAVLENSDMFPLEFTKGVYYNGIHMWGDLLWLDMHTEVLSQSQGYTHSRFIYNFKLQDKSFSNELIDNFIENLTSDNLEDISKEMSMQLAWKLKGMKKLYKDEQLINKKANEMLGIALQNQVKISEDLEKANEIIKEQSIKDFLTGLYNKRYFDEKFSELWFRSIRRKELVTVLMIDVDCFKLYNDTYGHLMGDNTLKKVAQSIKEVFQRHEDIVARFGGEEFIVATVETNKEQIKKHAENLITKIYNKKIPHQNSLVEKYVTVSIGISSIIPLNENSIDSLLTISDNALYKAKEKGRNRVEYIE